MDNSFLEYWRTQREAPGAIRRIAQKRPLDYIFKLIAYGRNRSVDAADRFPLSSVHTQNMIFISEFMQRRFSNYGVNSRKECVIRPGIPVTEIKCKRCYVLAGSVVRVVYSGIVLEHKGVDTLVAALNLVARQRPTKRIRLTVFGDDIRRLVRDGVDSNAIDVRIEGFIKRELLYEQLADNDIGIFPSSWEEPFGIAQIEMMAAGLPLISSGRGGSVEALDPGVDCLLFEAENKEDLAHKIIWLMDNYDSEAKKFGSRAREKVVTHFDESVSGERIRQMVATVINHSHEQVA